MSGVERLYNSWQSIPADLRGTFSHVHQENQALQARVRELEQRESRPRISRAELDRQVAQIRADEIAKAAKRRASTDARLRKLGVGNPIRRQQETIRLLDSMRRIPHE